MSNELLLALGEADANMYLCSKELRPSNNNCLLQRDATQSAMMRQYVVCLSVRL